MLLLLLLLLTVAPAAADDPGSIDGVIEDGEYTYNATAAGGDFELHWKVVDDQVQFGVKGKTNGWVAIGLEPTAFMKDADMYFGWFAGGETHANDAYATGNFGPHPKDTDLGGTFDIDEFNVTQSGGWTTFEFIRQLDT
ncbi:MAG: hypothetical protein KAS77_07360, partial [Thermoplasmata archaeon]|nr:hypothetical protein [Thermoplasmata archaeon]